MKTWLLALTMLFAPVALGQDTPDLETGIKPNVIRWGTASEHDNFGFEVFRGTAEGGPFERITPDPIQGAGTTDLPQRYEYHDADIEPGRVYWYYVESVSFSGKRVRVSPIYPSKPQSKPNAKPTSDE
jgi:hypothetical protein